MKGGSVIKGQEPVGCVTGGESHDCDGQGLLMLLSLVSFLRPDLGGAITPVNCSHDGDLTL